MENFRDNLIHRPLRQFYYGSLAVIIFALAIGAYYLSSSFTDKERNRASISSLQVSEALGSEHRYIVEEFFTGSYESVFMRISNSLQKFGSPMFEVYLFNHGGECIYGKDQDANDLPCRSDILAQENQFLYEPRLILGNADLGQLKVLVEDKFKFFTGSSLHFTLKNFVPVFVSVLLLWGLWILFSKKFILDPYYKKMIALEKERVSTDIVRQIIHDTRSEIAALDLYTLDIEDTKKAEEIRRTLHNIRESFGNLAHHKEGIVTSIREVPVHVNALFLDFIEQQKIKYKRHAPGVLIEANCESNSEAKIKVDANTFYRVLSNLVENAVSATNQRDQIEISLGLKEINDFVLIEIQDNGHGIPPEHHKHIFAKGFTTKDDGSGQGLSFVKRTVEAWGGTISFESGWIEQTGAKFTIKVPTYAKPKVVILDDSTNLLYRYKKLVERFGHEVEGFSEVSSFFARASFFEKDTIFLLDFNLSDELDGSEIGRKLSELGMTQIYLHTGNPSLNKKDFPFIKDILNKGNFMETITRLGIS
jgi:signal transduction histidine kinase